MTLQTLLRRVALFVSVATGAAMLALVFIAYVSPQHIVDLLAMQSLCA